MHIVVINPLWPHPSHSVRAANVVLFELLSSLVRQPGVKLSFVKLNRDGEPSPTEAEMQGITFLRNAGVFITEPFSLAPAARRSRFQRAMHPIVEDFYPEISQTEQFRAVLEDVKPDMLFLPWTEWATAMCSALPFPKFAYYGNPDAKSALAMIEFERRHGRLGYFPYHMQKRAYHKLEEFHIHNMLRYDFVGDVAANDALYYNAHGHPNSFYIQNVWADRFPDWRDRKKSFSRNKKAKIVGNIGKLSGTANTHGLEIFGKEFFPALRSMLPPESFEVHIFGAGSPHPAVAEALKAPEVILRGFVDDIDAEILSSDVFVCFNNASAYKVGHTRYLHAWSLGSCVIAHQDAALSMPEISHGKNSLLGKTAEEMAELVRNAVQDDSLRATMGEGGYRTFQEYFLAEKVAQKILRKIYEKYPEKNR